MNSKIMLEHRQKLACVYVRQSCFQQVLHNQQSAERQHALREKAAQLGWTPGNIQVLDGDLDVSGPQTTGREDFKRLVANVSKQLDVVFRKMVAKMVEDRYQSMSEAIEALEGLGLAGSTTGGNGDIATTLALSSEDRKKSASKTTKKPLGSLTKVVASEKTKNVLAKIVGGTFATIIAPILVTLLIKYLEKSDTPPTPPAAHVPVASAASVPPVGMNDVGLHAPELWRPAIRPFAAARDGLEENLFRPHASVRSVASQRNDINVFEILQHEGDGFVPLKGLPLISVGFLATHVDDLSR